MTEPTAEQVSAEMALAGETQVYFEYGPMALRLLIATALARVRIEAQAAGRDDGLREAEAMVPDLASRVQIRALRGVNP